MVKRISRKGFLAAAMLERMARVLLTKSPRNVHGFKCWSGDARCIEQGSSVVFLGVNPSGGREALAHDRDQGYLGAPYERREPPWNAHLDERWPDGDPYSPHQKRVHRLFEALYGSEWEGALRATACWNVCAYRTARVGDLPPELWFYSIDWAAKALISVAPEWILCDGNGPGRSPWAAVKSAFGMEIVGEWKVDPDSRTSRRVKLGRLKGNYYAGAGYLTGTRVLGLPSMSARHASLWASDPLRSLIREVATENSLPRPR